MINTGTQQLETERFILRRFVEEDYHARYHKWAKHEECAREDYYHWGIVCKEYRNL